MLSATNALFSALFGDILPAWLELDTIQYLFGIVIFSVVVSIVIKFFKRG